MACGGMLVVRRPARFCFEQDFWLKFVLRGLVNIPRQMVGRIRADVGEPAGASCTPWQTSERAASRRHSIPGATRVLVSEKEYLVHCSPHEIHRCSLYASGELVLLFKQIQPPITSASA